MGANELRQRRSGAVLAPGADGYDGYDEARSTHNGGFDSRPGLIVRCADADDVATAVGHAHVNLLGEDEADRLPEVYSEHDRLIRLKSELDPQNLLGQVLNIPPAR